MSQCLDIQNLAYETAMAFKSLPSSDEAVERHARKCMALAQAARAWEAAANRARILRGRPLPGSLRPKPVVRRRRGWPYERMIRPTLAAEPVPVAPSPAVPIDTPTEKSDDLDPPAAAGQPSTAQSA